MEENQILEQRKERALAFLKEKQQWLYYVGLAIVVWFGAIFIRTANVSRLKDVTGGWTLAPDLDPYLFLRWAQYIVDNGSLMAVDMMRYVPFGIGTQAELPVVPYGIAYLYKFMSIFSSNVDVTYAAIIFPVVSFVATLIIFFMLVRRVFRDNKLNNLIALLATLIFAVIPGFVHRSVAGVPEKESIAFFFMFLAFYGIVVGWQSKEWKKAGLFGLFAGVATALMGLTWGGVTFAIVVIALAAFAYFFTKNFGIKDIIAYTGWIIGFTVLMFPHKRYGVGLFTSTTTGLAYFVLGLFVVYFILFETKLKEKLRIDRIHLPPKAVALISLMVLGFIGVLIFEPGMVVGGFNDLKSNLITPFEGDRLTVTVAENSRTYFNSWKGSFGSFFWVFFFGSMLLLYEAITSFKSKNLMVLTTTFVLLLLGIVFTRVKPDSIFNGTSMFSLFLFLGSMVLFLGSMIYVYFKEEDLSIDSGIILALAWVFFGLLSARGAIRLLYFVYPIAALVGSFATIRLAQKTFETKEDVMKIIIGVLALVVIGITLWSVYTYSMGSYNEVKFGSVPSSYNVQWQQAMGWVRDNTPTDAVFAHWWDYGYWVQTIGERATILDGGNAYAYWDHLMGRHVLTAQNEVEALEYLKTYGGDYLLIDSTDIGKYTAFSSIGSDEDYDRYSFMPTFHLDEKSTQEKRNETLYVLNGGVMVDEDIVWKDQIFAGGVAGIGGFILPIERVEDTVTGKMNQPKAVVINKGQQIQVPVKCVYLDGKIEFKEEGIDGCIYLLPKVDSGGVKRIGGALWLSPRLMRSLLVKMFLLGEGENFELVLTQNHPAIDELNTNYNLNLPSFSIVQGQFLGPIKIWKANIPEDIEEKPEYLEKSYPEDRPGLWQVGK